MVEKELKTFYHTTKIIFTVLEEQRKAFGCT
jgi:hypothetical protein